jgi:hypothetical protein
MRGFCDLIGGVESGREENQRGEECFHARTFAHRPAQCVIAEFGFRQKKCDARFGATVISHVGNGGRREGKTVPAGRFEERPIDRVSDGAAAGRAVGEMPQEALLIHVKRLRAAIETRAAKLRGVRGRPSRSCKSLPRRETAHVFLEATVFAEEDVAGRRADEVVGLRERAALVDS